MDLPKEECAGEWCPVLSNLRRPSKECVGRYDNLKVIPLNAELFFHLSEIGRAATASGVYLRWLLSS